MWSNSGGAILIVALDNVPCIKYNFDAGCEDMCTNAWHICFRLVHANCGAQKSKRNTVALGNDKGKGKKRKHWETFSDSSSLSDSLFFDSSSFDFGGKEMIQTAICLKTAWSNALVH